MTLREVQAYAAEGNAKRAPRKPSTRLPKNEECKCPEDGSTVCPGCAATTVNTSSQVANLNQSPILAQNSHRCKNSKAKENMREFSKTNSNRPKSSPKSLKQRKSTFERQKYSNSSVSNSESFNESQSISSNSDVRKIPRTRSRTRERNQPSCDCQ